MEEFLRDGLDIECLIVSLLNGKERSGDRCAKPLDSFKELCKARSKRPHDFVQSSDADLLFPALHFREMLSCQLRVVCEHGLGPSALRPQDANPPSDLHADIHCHGSMAWLYALAYT
jgi:hypothetical protein